jgi:hypothetical protein
MLLTADYILSMEGKSRDFFDTAPLVFRVFAICAFGVLWTISCHLGAETLRWNKRRLIGIVAAGFLGIGAFFLQPTFPKIWEMMFLGMGLGILPFIAPFARQNEPMLPFSRHVANFATGIGQGIIFYGIIAALIALFTAGLKYLLNLELPDFLTERLYLYIGILFPVLYALSTIPAVSNQEELVVSRAASFVVTYLAIPALFAFALLLLVYGLKILVLWELPKGGLGIMAGNFGAFGLGTWLMAQCCPNAKVRLVTAYQKFFPYLWLPITLLLAVSIGTRVVAHGLTEQRLFVMLMTAWFFITNILLLTAPQRSLAALKILAVVLILGSVGTWSVSNVAYYDIHKRFVANLAEIGALRQGMPVKIQSKEVAAVPKEKVCALSMAADYFVEQKRVQQMAGILPIKSKTPTSRAIMEGFGLPYADTYTCRFENVWDMARGGDFTLKMQKNDDVLIPVSGFDSVWKLEYFSKEGRVTLPNKTKIVLRLQKKAGILTLSNENGLVQSIDLRADVQKLYDRGLFETRKSYKDSIYWNTKDNLSIDVAMEGVNIRILFFNVAGTIKADKVQSIESFYAAILFAMPQGNTP